VSAYLAARASERFAAAVGTRLDGAPCAIMLDVDGTLAPIAPTPEAAAIPAATRSTLARLAALPSVTLAFVSGRSAADAWRMTGIEGTWVIGNHGFELRTPDGVLTPVDSVRPYETMIIEASRALSEAAHGVAGAIVENKRWTISLHYRMVDPEAVPVLTTRARAVAERLGLWLTEGKKIVELRPPVHVNKGTATVALGEELGVFREKASVLYAGDDRTDEDAFTELRARQPRAVTVHVAATDGAVHSGAEVVVRSTEELRATLDWIVARRSRG
jgi:trehalose 6-phosphate phosphatase